MNKEPLNLDVVIELILQVLKNTELFFEKAKEADRQYGNEIVELDKVVLAVNKYKNQKLIYGNVVNGKVFYNFEEVLQIKLKNDFSFYDLIELAVGVLLTQNRASIWLKVLPKSYGFDLVINLLNKICESLKVNENFIEFKKLSAKQVKFDFEFEKSEDKIKYIRKNLQIEFDFNLFLKAYKLEEKEEENGESGKACEEKDKKE